MLSSLQKVRQQNLAILAQRLGKQRLQDQLAQCKKQGADSSGQDYEAVVLAVRNLKLENQQLQAKLLQFKEKAGLHAADFEERIKKLQAQNAHLKSELQKSTANNYSVQSLLTEKQKSTAEVARLRRLNEQLNLKNQSNGQTIKELRAQIARLGSIEEVSLASKKVEQLQDKLEEKSGVVKMLQQKLASIYDNRFKDEPADLLGAILHDEQLAGQIREKQRRLQELLQELASKQEKVRALEMRTQAAIVRDESFERGVQFSTIQPVVRSTREEDDTLFELLKTENAVLQQKCRRLEGQLEQCQLERQQVSSRCVKLQQLTKPRTVFFSGRA